MYKNAFETVCITENNDEYDAGWTDIIKKEKHIFKNIKKMVTDRKSQEAKTIAVLYYKHSKKSVRIIADKIINDEDFEIEDRTDISI